jgi:hypothetical protein
VDASEQDQMLSLLAIGEEPIDSIDRKSHVAWREREKPRRVVNDRRGIETLLFR